MIYGKHLILRIKNIERSQHLGDTVLIVKFLETLVRSIGMRILAGPIAEIESGDKLKSGCSGVVLLYESHAAIHTYDIKQEAFLDIFSCKDYDVAQVINVLKETFGSFEIEEQKIIDRGLHWGEDIKKENINWNKKR